MATEGPRRSTRARKPVKSYAEEFAVQDDFGAPPSKRQKMDVDVSAKGTKSAKSTKKGGRKVKTEDDDDDAEPTESKPTKQKKERKVSTKSKPTTASNEWHESAAERRNAATLRRIERLAPGEEEIRLRDYVDEPNAKFGRFLKSALTQRMFILDRERSVEDDCHANHHDCPVETVQIAGSSGNVYTVNISHLPTCSCPVGIFQRKNQEQCCKHVIYVLDRMLKAPEELKCQNAFLTHELHALFANAPIASDEVKEEEASDGNRKDVEGDCPICFTEFEEGEDIVWCRAACGNNIHETCFKQWEQSKYGQVTCPFCRSAWEAEAAKTQKANVANINVPEKDGVGYRNVRHLLDYEED